MSTNHPLLFPPPDFAVPKPYTYTALNVCMVVLGEAKILNPPETDCELGMQGRMIQ